MAVVDPCLVRFVDASGRPVLRLGVPLLDAYLDFVAGRCRPVAASHEARLAEPVEHMGRAIGRFRAGELDAFAAGQVLYQYSRSAKELWKFCNLVDVEMTAQAIHDRPRIDWWGSGTLKRP